MDPRRPMPVAPAAATAATRVGLSSKGSSVRSPNAHGSGSSSNSNNGSSNGGSGVILPMLAPPPRAPSPGGANASRRMVWTTPRGPGDAPSTPEPISPAGVGAGVVLPRRPSRGAPCTSDSTGGSESPPRATIRYWNDGAPTTTTLREGDGANDKRNDDDLNGDAGAGAGPPMDEAAQLAHMDEMYRTIQVLNAELERERADARRRAGTVEYQVEAREHGALDGFQRFGATVEASENFGLVGTQVPLTSSPASSAAAVNRRFRPHQPRSTSSPAPEAVLAKDQRDLCAALGKNAELRMRTREMERQSEETASALEHTQRQIKLNERRIANREEKLRALLKEKLHWQNEMKDLREQVVEEKMRQVDLFRRLETVKREAAAQVETVTHSLRDLEDENLGLRTQLAESKSHLAASIKKMEDFVKQSREEKEKLTDCIADARNKFREWRDGEATALKAQRDQAINHLKAEYELKIARHQEEKQKLRDKVKDLEVSVRLMQKDRSLSPLELSLRKATILGSKENAGTTEAELIEAHVRIKELEALLEHSQEYQRRQENIIKVSESTISRLIQEREVAALETLANHSLTTSAAGWNPSGTADFPALGVSPSTNNPSSLSLSLSLRSISPVRPQQKSSSAANALSGSMFRQDSTALKPRPPPDSTPRPSAPPPRAQGIPSSPARKTSSERLLKLASEPKPAIPSIPVQPPAIVPAPSAKEQHLVNELNRLQRELAEAKEAHRRDFEDKRAPSATLARDERDDDPVDRDGPPPSSGGDALSDLDAPQSRDVQASLDATSSAGGPMATKDVNKTPSHEKLDEESADKTCAEETNESTPPASLDGSSEGSMKVDEERCGSVPSNEHGESHMTEAIHEDSMEFEESGERAPISNSNVTVEPDQDTQGANSILPTASLGTLAVANMSSNVEVRGNSVDPSTALVNPGVGDSIEGTELVERDLVAELGLDVEVISDSVDSTEEAVGSPPAAEEDVPELMLTEATEMVEYAADSSVSWNVEDDSLDSSLLTERTDSAVESVGSSPAADSNVSVESEEYATMADSTESTEMVEALPVAESQLALAVELAVEVAPIAEMGVVVVAMEKADIGRLTTEPEASQCAVDDIPLIDPVNVTSGGHRPSSFDDHASSHELIVDCVPSAALNLDADDDAEDCVSKDNCVLQHAQSDPIPIIVDATHTADSSETIQSSVDSAVCCESWIFVQARQLAIELMTECERQAMSRVVDIGSDEQETLTMASVERETTVTSLGELDTRCSVGRDTNTTPPIEIIVAVEMDDSIRGVSETFVAEVMQAALGVGCAKTATQVFMLDDRALVAEVSESYVSAIASEAVGCALSAVANRLLDQGPSSKDESAIYGAGDATLDAVEQSHGPLHEAIGDYENATDQEHTSECEPEMTDVASQIYEATPSDQSATLNENERISLFDVQVAASAFVAAVLAQTVGSIKTISRRSPSPTDNVDIQDSYIISEPRTESAIESLEAEQTEPDRASTTKMDDSSSDPVDTLLAVVTGATNNDLQFIESEQPTCRENCSATNFEPQEVTSPPVDCSDSDGSDSLVSFSGVEKVDQQADQPESCHSFLLEAAKHFVHSSVAEAISTITRAQSESNQLTAGVDEPEVPANRIDPSDLATCGLERRVATMYIDALASLALGKAAFTCPSSCQLKDRRSNLFEELPVLESPSIVAFKLESQQDADMDADRPSSDYQKVDNFAVSAVTSATNEDVACMPMAVESSNPCIEAGVVWSNADMGDTRQLLESGEADNAELVAKPIVEVGLRIVNNQDSPLETSPPPQHCNDSGVTRSANNEASEQSDAAPSGASVTMSAVSSGADTCTGAVNDEASDICEASTVALCSETLAHSINEAELGEPWNTRSKSDCSGGISNALSPHTHETVFSLSEESLLPQLSITTPPPAHDPSRYASSIVREQIRDPTLLAYDVKHERGTPFAMLDEKILRIDQNARHMQHDENDRAKGDHYESSLGLSDGMLITKKKKKDYDSHRKSIAARSIPAFNYQPVVVKFQWSDFVVASPIRCLSTVSRLNLLVGVTTTDGGVAQSDPRTASSVLTTSPVQKMKLLTKKGTKLPCGTYVIISVFNRPLEDGNENFRVQIYDSERVEEFQYDFHEDHLRDYVEEWHGSDAEALAFVARLEFRRDQGSIIIKMPDRIRPLAPEPTPPPMDPPVSPSKGFIPPPVEDPDAVLSQEFPELPPEPHYHLSPNAPVALPSWQVETLATSGSLLGPEPILETQRDDEEEGEGGVAEAQSDR